MDSEFFAKQKTELWIFSTTKEIGTFLVTARSVSPKQTTSTPLSRSQFVTLKRGQNIKYAPYAFTEQGVAMVSAVLRSKVSIAVNIEIMRAFVRFRELASTNAQVLKKVDDLEKRVTGHDTQLQQVFQAIRDLVQPNLSPRRPIGIKTKP